jgi:hypothetical protein
MLNERIVTVLVVIVIPFVLISVPLLLLNRSFKGFLSSDPIGKLIRCVIWFLAAGFLIFVALGVPIILYNVTNQNTASVITFLIYLVVGVPLCIWLDKNAYVLRDLAYPSIRPNLENHQHQHQYQQGLDIPMDRELGMPRIVIEEMPEAQPNRRGAPIPVNPRIRR